MENNQERKLGAGIITMSVIHLVLYFLSVAGLIFSLFAKDILTQQFEQMGLDGNSINTTTITISLILSFIFIVSVILILCKKAIGVYAYFIVTVVSIINSIITAGFDASILVNLILPALMAFFIYKRKYVFGFASKEDDLSA